MNEYIANYMWGFNPAEKLPTPSDCILSNKAFFKNSVVLTPENIEPLIRHFPDLVKLWHSIPHWIIKADLGRLIYIYFHGHFYFDVDCEINKEISVNSGNFLVLFTEIILSDVRHLGPRECKSPENVLRIANYAFGTNVLRHPFLHEVILECTSRLDQLIYSGVAKIYQHDILWVCGPDVITTIYHKSKHKYPELILLDTSYLSHLCRGSWRQSGT